MQIDPQHSLQLAFQHLEAFSVPGVGTFKREYFSADIDHSQKVISPPGEHFVLEKGESLSAQLEDFYFRYLDLKIDRAKDLVQEVGHFVMEELKSMGHLLLPGWGELKGDDTIEFSHQDDLMATPDDFFGLQPVGYSLGDLVPSDPESRKAAAVASVEANTTRVEAVPPPVGKRSKARPWLILLLVLLLIGSGSAMIWKDQFRGMLDRIGLVKGGDGGDPIAAIGPVTPIDSVDQVLTVEPDIDTSLADMEPALVDPVEPPISEDELAAETIVGETVSEISDDMPFAETIEDEPEVVVAEVEPVETVSKTKAGEFAQAGNYYLIVGAAGNGEEAKRLLSKFRKGGANPKIIAPRGSGLYKISVFQARDKMQVINKMVQWKDTFPAKSWIYWPGM